MLSGELRRAIADHYVALSRYAPGMIQCSVLLIGGSGVQVQARADFDGYSLEAATHAADPLAAIKAAFIALRHDLQVVLRRRRERIPDVDDEPPA